MLKKRLLKKSSGRGVFKNKVDGWEHKSKEYSKLFDETRKEIANIIVGQDEVIDSMLRCLIANGHALVEGVPGVAKTLLIRTLAKATGCDFKRIQFTIDLLPTDIIGITSYDPMKKEFRTEKGPVFTNFILADEINRSSPKTQSALLESMQEKQVTINKITYPLPLPFFVMATMNPLESEGVYPLPEAQIDRFLFKINMDLPNPKEEQAILKKNITLYRFEDYTVKAILNPKKIIEIQEFVRDKIYLSPELEEYIIRIVDATRKNEKFKLGRYIAYGGSPRASIGLFIAAKAQALLKGSSFVTPQHIKDVAKSVMRHRILLNYEGQAENITTDQIIDEIISKVPIP
ncbi:MAG: MoxR family ATPase [Candidatus Nanoarchaeia archaeon]|nr:MoxR family ATPase [Candidatus Nanoarchaeia archaeon]